MQRLRIVLDVTHLTDEAFWEALDLYDGPVWASHNNCRSLVPHQRQFNDDQLKELIRRDAIIGASILGSHLRRTTSHLRLRRPRQPPEA